MSKKTQRAQEARDKVRRLKGERNTLLSCYTALKELWKDSNTAIAYEFPIDSTKVTLVKLALEAEIAQAVFELFVEVGEYDFE